MGALRTTICAESRRVLERKTWSVRWPALTAMYRPVVPRKPTPSHVRMLSGSSTNRPTRLRESGEAFTQRTYACGATSTNVGPSSLQAVSARAPTAARARERRCMRESRTEDEEGRREGGRDVRQLVE